jgi:hypothetical protein
MADCFADITNTSHEGFVFLEGRPMHSYVYIFRECFTHINTILNVLPVEITAGFILMMSCPYFESDFENLDCYEGTTNQKFWIMVTVLCSGVLKFLDMQCTVGRTGVP